MSFMEDISYVCEHCGQKVNRWDTRKEPHDCFMKHIHKVLDAKNNKKPSKPYGTRRLRN